ncbi:ester cyclase [Maritalea sp.]|uniref:ester cyclase n=1 Tax=Maritalea sp. TaxID=2003361 RepID=UPI003EF6AA4B
MTYNLKAALVAAIITLPAVPTLAADMSPSHVSMPHGITAEQFYNGGSTSGTEAQSHIDKFDVLDFEVFSGQQWERLHESHDENIIVTWPDGHSTTGIEVHISDLKNMFVFAPDISIKTHPVKIGSGDWTTVIGVMSGTFSEPMPIGEGQFIEPTGRTFELKMATVGFWQDGLMIHEWLFWDNDTFYRQLGLRD